MNYVMHFCRNKKCNNGWIDKDLTNVKTIPSKWKYCKECCEKLGIDFDSQKPELTEAQKKKYEYNTKRAHEAKRNIES